MATLAAIRSAVTSAPVPTETPSPTPRAATRTSTPELTDTPQPSDTPGLTGTPIPSPPALGFHVDDIAFADALHGWILGDNALRATSDGGKSWHAVSFPRLRQKATGYSYAQIRFANPNEGWAFGAGLASTRDGGKTWTDENFQGNLIALEPMKGTLLAVEKGKCAEEEDERGCSFTLLVSKDKGKTFKPASVQPAIPPADGVELVRGDALHAWAYLDYPRTDPHSGAVIGWLLATSDGGITWYELTPLPKDLGQGCELSYSGKQLWLGCYIVFSGSLSEGWLYESSDGGQHWFKASDAGDGEVLAFTSPEHVIASGGEYTTLDVTFDGGCTWQAAREPDYFSYWWPVPVDRLVFADDLHGWAVFYTLDNSSREWLLRTTDGGKTWQDVVLHTTDGGQTWQSVVIQ